MIILPKISKFYYEFISSSKWILEDHESQWALLWLSPFSAYMKKVKPYPIITFSLVATFVFSVHFTPSMCVILGYTRGCDSRASETLCLPPEFMNHQERQKPIETKMLVKIGSSSKQAVDGGEEWG